MKSKVEKTELSYRERAGRMSKRARKIACRAAGELWREATKAAADLGSIEIECLNSMRAAGEKILEAAGRSQLLFTLEVKEFCRKEILPLLPPGMELEQVQACVQIASHIPKPIQNRDELRAVKAEVQLAFQALGLIETRRRKELQTPHTRNLFSDFVSMATNLKLLIDELESELPLEQWTTDALDEFLETMLPVKGTILRAEKIRLGIVDVK